MKFECHVEINGPRLPFGEFADRVFGKDSNLDTDGDSDQIFSTSWTELTLQQRELPFSRVDIDPFQTEPLILKVSGDDETLTRKAAKLLVQTTNGKIVS